MRDTSTARVGGWGTNVITDDMFGRRKRAARRQARTLVMLTRSVGARASSRGRAATVIEPQVNKRQV